MFRLILAALGLVMFASVSAPVVLAQTPPTLRPGTLPPPDPLPDEPETPEEIVPLENPFAFDGPMTPDRLGELILRVDENAEVAGNGYVFTVAERQLRVVYDENANRMRIITPILSAANLPEGLAERMLQANFDAVLDARYAIGSGPPTPAPTGVPQVSTVSVAGASANAMCEPGRRSKFSRGPIHCHATA